MEALFLALVQQLTGAVFTLIIILVLMFYIVFKAGSIITTFKHFEKKNEKVDMKFDEVTGTLAKIQATTDLLYQAHLRTVQRQSPIRLTPLGEEIARIASVDVKINEHWDAILNEVQQKNPQNPYDIQVVSMDIAQGCFDRIFTNTEQTEIKNFAYSRGLNLLEVYPVIGVKIRDRILKERGLSVEEVDKHAPTKDGGKT